MATNAAYIDGTYVVSNAWYQLSHVYEIIAFGGAEAATSTSLEISLPSDAVVDSAVFEVTADASGPTRLGSFAQVRRGGTTSDIVVDFGRMVTLHSIGGMAFESIERWNGVEYVPFEHEPPEGGELQTERLLIHFASAVDVDTAAEDLTATLPAVPTALELVVDGTVVWSQPQGNSPGFDTPAGVSGDGIGFTIDRTAEVARALEAASGPVRVELRSLTPGTLTLATYDDTGGDPQIEFHRVHPVAFPDGAARTIEVDEEGPLTLTLPLPDGSDSWTVSEVGLTVSAGIDPSRRLPSTGPTPTPDARLRMRPERVLLGRLPTELRDRALLLEGIRVAVRGGPEGGDLAGRVLVDADGSPGEPVEGAEFEPVEVTAGDEERWVTLALADPVGSEGAWIEIGPSVGTVDWVLTTDTAATTDTPGTEVFFRTPAGAVRAMPTLDTVGTLLGAVRLIVEPDPDRPLAALSLGVDGDDAAPVDMTPADSGTSCRIVTSGVVRPSGRTLVLTGVAATPGTYTFSDINVSYREESS